MEILQMSKTLSDFSKLRNEGAGWEIQIFWVYILSFSNIQAAFLIADTQ